MSFWGLGLLIFFGSVVIYFAGFLTCAILTAGSDADDRTGH